MSAVRHQSDEETPVIKLKVMMDKTRNRVIFAESDHEFVDTLCSFLTLPLGTVLRLLEKDMVQLGSVSRIYTSAYSLETRFLRTSHCKSMLIMPRNASEVHCEKLKLNVDHSENSGKLFTCSSYYCPYENKHLYSINEDAKCLCGSPMRSSIRVNEKGEDRSSMGESANGVFLKSGAASFMITDDLQIVPASTACLTALFEKLGVSDRNEIEAKTIEVGTKETFWSSIDRLINFNGEEIQGDFHLKQAEFRFLQNVFRITLALELLSGNWAKETSKFEINQTAKLEKKAAESQSSNSTSMKLIVSKSRKKILYAEAGVELVDLLFSFLTFPLGAVVKLLGSSSGLGCIDNLYRGAEDLSSQNYTRSEECKNRLLSPKLFPYSGFDSQILQVEEERWKYLLDNLELVRNDIKSEVEASDLAVILDPKSPSGETVKGEGYLKGPATFMIFDNLLVTPFSLTSVINLLNQMKVSTRDLDERNLIIGKYEALNLLKASLVSKTVLNDVFNRREPYPEVMLKV